ncbi:FadR family transcriptional regulator [Oceanobacillus piezotolerans]|uniref:FadR family transcriptional regulator n=1 Tax=Oceanobacillus piezotolerans TaxID=2448030 RepID=A0A498DLG7_9BACI|nr:GntR family transcriptional regulator [Oceanobacillus piezotolerans]RLL47880.1 FadR family transcriptional regulator [Oceanobacillus piezotolerans]
MTLSSKKKVYQGVLQEIRNFIELNQLNPGDKLPSERELAQTLHAGRSSVREALRALELLGIIETRAGEGTFLSNYRPLQTMEVLASFILREKDIRNDILHSKCLIEKEAAKLACTKINKVDLIKLEEIINDSSSSIKDKHLKLFDYIFGKTENLLLKRIWNLLEDFSTSISKKTYKENFYPALLKLLTNKDLPGIERLFMENTFVNN